MRLIHKMGRHAVDSNMVFFDGMEIPVEDRIGEEGKGFEYILHGLNPERILGASMAIGMGRYALNAAVKFANERTVWNPRPSDPGLEAEFLTRLMVKLGAPEASAREVAAKPAVDPRDRTIEQLKVKLVRKNEVVAELAEAHTRLKTSLGDH